MEQLVKDYGIEPTEDNSVNFNNFMSHIGRANQTYTKVGLELKVLKVSSGGLYSRLW